MGLEDGNRDFRKTRGRAFYGNGLETRLCDRARRAAWICAGNLDRDRENAYYFHCHLRNTMRLSGIVLVCLFTGCTTLDALTGVTSGDPGGGPVGSGASFLSSLGGWGTVAGGLLGLAGSTYGAYRAKRYGAIAQSVVAGVHKIRAMKNGSGKINMSEENLCEILRAVQVTAKTTKAVEKLINRVEEEEFRS